MSFWAGRKVLVPGGSGFVGSHLVELLIDEGATVTVSSRKEAPRFLADVASEVDLRHGDLEDPVFCRDIVAGQDTVLYLAAEVGGIHYNRLHHASLFASNLRPFLNVLEAVRETRPERFLITSSACVYPRHPSIPTPEQEGTHGEPEPTNGGYGWAKRMQEYLGTAAVQEYGLKIAIARPYNAYGPRDDFDPATSHVIPSLIRRVLSGEDPLKVWGSGNQTRTFLYVKDFVRGLLLCAERYAEGRPVNLGTDEETSIRELVELCLELIGRRPRVEYDTSRPEGQPRRCCDTTLMKRVLGWEPSTSLRDGLAETIRWYRKQAEA